MPPFINAQRIARHLTAHSSHIRNAGRLSFGTPEQVPDLVTTPVLRAELEGIRREMAELKADLIKWNVGAMAVLTAIFAAIVRLA